MNSISAIGFLMNYRLMSWGKINKHYDSRVCGAEKPFFYDMNDFLVIKNEIFF